MSKIIVIVNYAVNAGVFSMQFEHKTATVELESDLVNESDINTEVIRQIADLEDVPSNDINVMGLMSLN